MREQEEGASHARFLRLLAHAEAYPALIDAVDDFGRDLGIAELPEWHEFLTAVAEIGGNILNYAYADRDPGVVEMELVAFPTRVEARFRDRGTRFVESPVTTVVDDAETDDIVELLAERGRGLAIARAALTSLEYVRTPAEENHWRLVKQIAPK